MVAGRSFGRRNRFEGLDHGRRHYRSSFAVTALATEQERGTSTGTYHRLYLVFNGAFSTVD